MNHSTQTDLDTWLPVGELFAQIVAGLAPKVLGNCAGRMREVTRPASATRWEEEASDGEN